MPSAEQKHEAPDLTTLKEMVGVSKDLKAMVAKKQTLDKAAVLGVLETHRKVYAANGLFLKKEMAITAVIGALEQGAVSADAVIQAAGADLNAPKPAQGGFSLGRLFGKARS